MGRDRYAPFDIPAEAQRTVITIYHDNITVTYEFSGKHGHWFPQRNDRFSFEQFAKALQALGFGILSRIASGNSGGDINTVSGEKENDGISSPTQDHTAASSNG